MTIIGPRRVVGVWCSQQGLPLPPDGAGHGRQAGDCRQQDLAPPQRLREVAPGHPRHQIHRRHSRRPNRNPRRRLIMSSPTFDHSSVRRLLTLVYARNVCHPTRSSIPGTPSQAIQWSLTALVRTTSGYLPNLQRTRSHPLHVFGASAIEESRISPPSHVFPR